MSDGPLDYLILITRPWVSRLRTLSGGKCQRIKLASERITSKAEIKASAAIRSLSVTH